MSGRLYGFTFLTLLILSSCAGSRSLPTGRRSTAVDYNSYSEDLASVRPVYNVIPTAPTPSANRPASTAPTPSTAPRKTDTRKANAPVEALHVNRKLDIVLDTLATENQSIRYAPGYRIQIYVGTQRQQVEDAKRMITQEFPELSPYLSYNQPTYKLKVGDFMRRLDAERYYTSIRKMIASAQLQADKVDIRRSLLIK